MSSLLLKEFMLQLGCFWQQQYHLGCLFISTAEESFRKGKVLWGT